MRVLIAEDDPTSLLILRKVVEKLGHECLVAEDGDAAWEGYLEELPDVVITDWMMPGIDGSEVVRRIREQPRYCYVVMLTALSGDDHAEAGMSAGADSYLGKPLDNGQLKLALIAAERMTAVHRELADREAELQAANERLTDESRSDGLTGLGNRLRMREDLVRLDDAHQRYGHPYALVLVDLDRFKGYNDLYGHLAGDEALRSVARKLDAGLRSADFVYRYGGEELLVILPEQTLEAARGVTERLCEAVTNAAIEHEANPPFGVITVSAGIAAAATDSRAESEVILHAADKALYEAKALGRNRVETASALALPAEPRARPATALPSRGR